MNDAVYNVHTGVRDGDWHRAFYLGWVRLYSMGEQDRLDMATTEQLVQLLGKESDYTIIKYWPGILQKLLIPLAKREIENDISSYVATFIARMARRASGRDDRWLDRIMQFWRAYVRDVKARDLAHYSGHPHGLLQIPANLFTAVALSYYRAFKLRKTAQYDLSAFLASCETVIAVPLRFGVTGALGQTQYYAKDLLADPEDQARLRTWFNQCELYRIWQRHGDEGIRYANVKWRERRNEKATEHLWRQIEEALREEGPSSWWSIDWRDEIYRRTKGKDSADSKHSGVQSTQSWEPADSGDLPPVRVDMEVPLNVDTSVTHRARARLPAKFTPALVSEFIHTFLHLNMPQQAEAVWSFCTEELRLAPTLIMWNARLLGHSAQRDSDAVEKVFMEMETKAGIKADSVSWSILVNSYFRAGKAESGLERMQQLMANKALRDGSPDGKLPIRVYNVMLNALLWDDSKETAMQFLANMTSDEPEAPGVDIYTVNILLRYYSRARTFDLAKISETIELVERYKLQPDHYTFTTILDALLRAGRADAVERIQLIMENMQVQANVATYSAIIDHLVKSSKHAESDAGLRAALALLRKMQDSNTPEEAQSAARSVAKPNEITYTSLIQGFARWATDRESPQHFQIAEQLHSEMLSLNIPPNRITYNSLMSASLAAEDVAKALLYFRAHRDMKRKRMSSTPANALHATTARLEADDSILDEAVLMSERIAPRTWQALIAGLVKYKHWGEAKAILEEMKALGIVMDDPSFQKLARKVEHATLATPF